MFLTILATLSVGLTSPETPFLPPPLIRGQPGRGNAPPLPWCPDDFRAARATGGGPGVSAPALY
jgi:hypothetical protein